MVLSDKALISSYKLSIVTMPLTEVVWSPFTKNVQIFINAVSTCQALLKVEYCPQYYANKSTKNPSDLDL